MRDDSMHPFVNWLGYTLELTDDACVVTLPLRPEVCNSSAMLQGGIVATLADLAGGALAHRCATPGAVVTADLNIHYLAPGRVGPIRATSRVVRAGKRLVITGVEVVDVGAEDLLMAVASMSSAVVRPRP